MFARRAQFLFVENEEKEENEQTKEADGADDESRDLSVADGH